MPVETPVPSIEVSSTPAPVPTMEMVGVSEDLFLSRMDSAENLLLGNVVCSALIVSALLATLVMRFFHVQ
ncbi:MAG: hypothetical protein RRY04_01905 [Oscillospiraceae bacterium]